MNSKEKRKAISKEKKAQILANKVCFISWCKSISRKINNLNIKLENERKANQQPAHKNKKKTIND